MRDAPEKFPGLERDMTEALKKQAIELSVKYRVLCPFTSLLVLETEQDYARFGIERRALANILTVNTAGITLTHRSDFATPALASPQDSVLQRTGGRTDLAKGTATLDIGGPPGAEGAAEMMAADANREEAEVEADVRARGKVSNAARGRPPPGPRPRRRSGPPRRGPASRRRKARLRKRRVAATAAGRRWTTSIGRRCSRAPRRRPRPRRRRRWKVS